MGVPGRLVKCKFGGPLTDKPRCERKAAWHISWGNSVLDETEVCVVHFSRMCQWILENRQVRNLMVRRLDA